LFLLLLLNRHPCAMQWFPIWQQFLLVCAMVCSLFYLTLRFTKYPCAMQWSLEFLCLFTIFCDVVHRLPLRDAVILMAETNKIFVSTLAFFFFCTVLKLTGIPARCIYSSQERAVTCNRYLLVIIFFFFIY